MKISFNKILYQLYLLPTVVVTYDRMLTGNYRLGIWWLEWGLEIELE